VEINKKKIVADRRTVHDYRPPAVRSPVLTSCRITSHPVPMHLMRWKWKCRRAQADV